MTLWLNKKKIPGPNQYKPKFPPTKCKLYSSKAYAGNAFIDEATYKGMQTPGIQNIKYVSVHFLLNFSNSYFLI